MGVVVSETTRETMIAAESVTANSRNSRPSIPPMRRMGMNTATRETLMERTVKPISRAPMQGGLVGGNALFQVTGDVFKNDDGIIDDKPRRDCEGHEREVVEAVAAQVHDPERGDERDRHGNARDEGAPDMPQKREDNQNHKYAGDDQSALDILQRGADCCCPVDDDGEVDRSGDGCFQLRQQLDDPVDGLDDICPRLTENDHHHGGLAVHESRIAHILDRVLDVGNIGELHRSPSLVGNDNRAVQFRLVKI